MRKLAKKLGVLLMAGIMVGAMFTGCGTKEADSAEASVEYFMEAAKEVDFDTMAMYTTEDTWDDQVEEMVTVDAWKNFFELIAPKMTYEITDVKEEGDLTTVTVAVKYLDGTAVYTAAINEYFTEAMAMMTEDDSLDEQAIMDLLDEILQEKTKDMEETYSEKTLVFVCDNNNQFRINNVDDEFAAVLTGNLTAIADTLGEDAVTE